MVRKANLKGHKINSQIFLP